MAVETNSNMHRKALLTFLFHNIQDKVFKNGPNKISGRQPLKNLK